MTEEKEIYIATSSLGEQEHQHTINFTEEGFRCTDPSCNKIWTAEEAAQILQNHENLERISEISAIEALLEMWPSDGYEHVEDERIYIKSDSFNRSRFHTLSKRYELTIYQTIEGEKYQKEVSFGSERILSLAAALLVLRKVVLEEEAKAKREQAQETTELKTSAVDYSDSGLGEIEDHPF